MLSPRLRRRRAFTLVLMTLVLPAAPSSSPGGAAWAVWPCGSGPLLLGAGILVGLLFLVSRSAVFGLFGRSWFLTIVQWDPVRPGRALGGAVPRRLAAGPSQRPGHHHPALADRADRRADAALARQPRVRRDHRRRGPRRPRRTVPGQARRRADGRPLQRAPARWDSGKDRVGTRPDSIQLVSVDAPDRPRRDVRLLPRPRTSTFRPGSVMHRLMPEGWNCGDECLLNGLYTWGRGTTRRSSRQARRTPACSRRGGRRGASGSRRPLLRAGRPPRLPRDGRRPRRAGHHGPEAHPHRRRHLPPSAAGSSRGAAPERLPGAVVLPPPGRARRTTSACPAALRH